MTITLATFILKCALFLCVGTFSGCMISYIKNYHIIELVITKIKGDVLEYDRIRRQQMKKDITEDRSFLKTSNEKETKESFISKIYRRLEMTGITEKIPGFSELMFAILILIFAIIIFGALTIFSSIYTGIAGAAVFLIGTWYILGIIAYNRRMHVESQLLQFTNSCASASRQYSNIIDIIGSIYDQFTGSFRESLEACYVEAKTTNDSDTAFKHLTNKYDSAQFSMIIDNLIMCSSSTGDYYSTAIDLTKIITVYSSSHERKTVTLRNSKVNIVVMFVISAFIIYALSVFFDGAINMLIHTPLGNIILIAFVAVFVFGMSIKTEK